jgi:hypothetical protein
MRLLSEENPTLGCPSTLPPLTRSGDSPDSGIAIHFHRGHGPQRVEIGDLRARRVRHLAIGHVLHLVRIGCLGALHIRCRTTELTE